MGKIRYRTIEIDQDTVLIEEIHKVVVHEFAMGDVEDPDLYAAEPLLEWQKSEAGKFVMENSISEPVWHRQPDPFNYGYQYVIVAELEMKKLSEFYLRFDKSDKKNI